MSKSFDISALTAKYDVPVPRYTSYPTVPFWETQHFTVEKWQNEFENAFAKNADDGLSLYFHIPFCEKLCTYCACNKRITTNHQVELPYIEALLKEWRMYLNLMGRKPLLKEIHFGGGTPTFLSPENIAKLLDGIYSEAILADEHEFSVEVHPNYTTAAHLATFFDYGFRRLSVGIQDFDEKVQKAINRPQSFEETKRVFDEARKIGYEAVNADLVYGLPFQSLEGVKKTIALVNELRPERIAFYGYAHVPWKSKAQRHYTESDLPKGAEKLALYEYGRLAFLENNYAEIGLDHFALAEDNLYKAHEAGQLHRNFMGYTTQDTKVLLGLGASSISDTWSSFAQNVKEVEVYQTMVNEGKFPIEKGHLLNDVDLYLRKHILALMCHGKTSWSENDAHAAYMLRGVARLEEQIADGLVTIEGNALQVTALGQRFLRNVAVAFDEHFWKNKTSEQNVFSRAI